MLIWLLTEVSVCQTNGRIIFFRSWLMLPVGWYFKTLNIPFPHNLLPNGFSFLTFLFWVNILSILEFQAVNFYHTTPSPNSSHICSHLPTAQLWVFFFVSLSTELCVCGPTTLEGGLPWSVGDLLEGGLLRENWLSHSPKLSNSFSARDGAMCLPPSPMLGFNLF